MTPSQDPENAVEEFRRAFEDLGPDPEYPGLDLKDAADRLITFANWPLQTPTKEKLAEAGFYYINKGDLVKCAYCQVKIGRWEPGDDPEVEHRKYSSPSKCLFLRWSKSTTPENYTAEERTGDTCGPYGLAGVRQAVLKHDQLTRGVLGDRYHNASYVSVHEDHSYYCERLKTFDDWSSDSKISKEALSEAGFIYRHEEDHTVCFHCGGALRKWEENDDPWEEHAGWFPDCKFVLTMKGQKFIDEAVRKRALLNRPREENVCMDNGLSTDRPDT